MNIKQSTASQNFNFLTHPPRVPACRMFSHYRKPPTKQTEAEREKDLLMKRLLDAQALIANAVNEGQSSV